MAQGFAALAALVAAWLAYCIYGRARQRWHLSHLPGPSIYGQLLFGSLPHLRRVGLVQHHRELAQKYGPICRDHGVNGASVVVSSPELIRDVLNHHQNRPVAHPLHTTRQTREYEKGAIIRARGDKWRSLRAAWSPLFFTGSLENYSRVISCAAERLADSLEPAARSGEAVDVWRPVGDASMQIIMEAAFGVDLKLQAPASELTEAELSTRTRVREDANIFFSLGAGSKASKYTIAALLVPELRPLLHWLSLCLPDKPMVELRAARQRQMEYSIGLVRAHRAAAAAGRVQTLDKASVRAGVQPGSFIDLLSREVDRSTGKPFKDAEVAASASVALLAGFETTANTVAFTLWQLAHSPSAQASLQAEIDSTPGELTHQSMDSCYPYLDACIRESLRLESPLPAAAREAGQDCVLGGYRITKGTMLVCATSALHRSEALWKDADTFSPERWLNGKDVPSSHAWAAFGGGPRACVGMRLAMDEARAMLIALLRRFSFRLGPGMEPLPLRFGVTLGPARGVVCTVHRRAGKV